MKKASFENLKELLENHKKETYSCKEYSFDNTSYTLLLADINNLLKENELLKQQAKKQKEVIDKTIKLIKYHERYRDGADCCQFVDIVSEILEPLQSILEQDETTNNAYLKEFEDWLKEVSE